jgi:hypothetical protein
VEKRYRDGKGTLDGLMPWSILHLQSRLALSHEQAENIAAYEQYWRIAIAAETVAELKFEAGAAPTHDLFDSKERRLQAEIWLIQSRAGNNPK